MLRQADITQRWNQLESGPRYYPGCILGVSTNSEVQAMASACGESGPGYPHLALFKSRVLQIRTNVEACFFWGNVCPLSVMVNGATYRAAISSPPAQPHRQNVHLRLRTTAPSRSSHTWRHVFRFADRACARRPGRHYPRPSGHRRFLPSPDHSATTRNPAFARRLVRRP